MALLETGSYSWKEENRITDIPRREPSLADFPYPSCRTTYHPGVLVVAQRTKQADLGRTSFSTTSHAFP